MNSFFKTFFACLFAIIIGGVLSFVFGLIVITGLVSSMVSVESYVVKEGSILHLDFKESMVEKKSGSVFESLDITSFKVNRSIAILEATSLVERAAKDPMIKGILIDIPMTMTSSSSAIYELREAIEKFKTGSGKFVIAYGDVYSQGGYLLASVADKVFMNPQGGVSWIGLSSSAMFYKGALDKLGVTPEVIRHGKFKGAVEPFVLDKLSAENRIQIEGLTGSSWGYIVGTIARSRSLDSTTMQTWASNLTPSTANQALQLKMVDSLIYRDQLVEYMGTLTTHHEPRLVSLGKYFAARGAYLGPDAMAEDEVAIVYADGDIVDSGSTETKIVGHALAATLAKLRLDDDVKAVVMRVNSPGGSAFASDVVWREVSLLRAVKPVVVSMGNYAASGGYYISCVADRLVASPLTITGSIGVFGLMFNVQQGAKDLLGVTVDVVNTNTSADLGNMFRTMTPAERMYMQRGVDTVYTRFASLVAQGRNMTYAQVDSLAQGRVWSGVQALSNGLIDRYGTLLDAITVADELAGLNGKYHVEQYPKYDGSFSTAFESLATQSMVYFTDWGKAQDKMVEALKSKQGIRAEMEYKLSLGN